MPERQAATGRTRLREALSTGRPALGCWLSLGSTGVAEVVGNAGFDWLLLDQQHSAVGPEGLLDLIRATNLTPASPIVRVPANEAMWIAQALDSGAHGIMVPLVSTLAGAQRAVAAALYPPRGTRSIGGYRAQYSFGLTREAYLAGGEADPQIWLQLEDADAIENADRIAGVDGVTGLFIGPQDLAAALGLTPSLEPDAEDYRDALVHVRDVAARHGRHLGILVASREAAVRRAEEGFVLIAAAIDSRLLNEAGSAIVRSFLNDG